MPRFKIPISPERRIQQLENNLYEARQAIINLMPGPIYEVLTDYIGCKSRQDTYSWKRNITTFLISEAKILSPQEGSYFSDRAYCPLCSDGTTNYYERGFSVPEGLKRHLSGWGNMAQCSVMKAVLDLANDYWDEELGEPNK